MLNDFINSSTRSLTKQGSNPFYTHKASYQVIQEHKAGRLMELKSAGKFTNEEIDRMANF